MVCVPWLSWQVTLEWLHLCRAEPGPRAGLTSMLGFGLWAPCFWGCWGWRWQPPTQDPLAPGTVTTAGAALGRGWWVLEAVPGLGRAAIHRPWESAEDQPRFRLRPSHPGAYRTSVQGGAPEPHKLRAGSRVSRGCRARPGSGGPAGAAAGLAVVPVAAEVHPDGQSAVGARLVLAAVIWGLCGAGLKVTGLPAHGLHQRVTSADDVSPLVALHVPHPHAHPAGLGAL